MQYPHSQRTQVLEAAGVGDSAHGSVSNLGICEGVSVGISSAHGKDRCGDIVIRYTFPVIPTAHPGQSTGYSTTSVDGKTAQNMGISVLSTYPRR